MFAYQFLHFQYHEYLSQSQTIMKLSQFILMKHLKPTPKKIQFICMNQFRNIKDQCLKNNIMNIHLIKPILTFALSLKII